MSSERAPADKRKLPLTTKLDVKYGLTNAWTFVIRHEEMIKHFADNDSVGLSDVTKQKKTHLRPVLLMESHMVGSVSQNFFPIFSKTA